MYLQEKVRELNGKLTELGNMSVIAIWGAGEHTCRLFEKTELLLYPIKYIVDMDESKKGNKYFGFTIKKPDEMAWDSIEAVVISVPGKEKQITEILQKQFRFRGKIISFYEKEKIMPFYRLYDEKIHTICYIGDYSNWDKAANECKGYDDSIIIDKVIDSTSKVLNGDAVWERDSYLFYEQKYVYRICAAVLKCALQNGNQGVRILDVGGALGSTYFQNRKYLKDVKNLEYIIAEQNEFAEYGHRNLENQVLKFINSELETHEDYGKFDIVLLSGSLQYISCYKEVIKKIEKVKPRYIILDRILVGDRMRICKEEVAEEIYKSSYPVMIYTENEIMSFFDSAYELIEKDISSTHEVVFFEDGIADSRYYVFQYTGKKYENEN